MAERMTSRSNPADDTRPGARRDDTVPAQDERQREAPRMPHEQDESASSQAGGESSARRIGQAAYDDVQRGVADTTRGAELDATYHALRSSQAPRKGEREPGRD